MTRVAQRDLQAAVDVGGWSTSMKLSSLALENFADLRRDMAVFDGYAIQSPATAISLCACLGPVTTVSSDPTIHHSQFSAIVAGDASDSAVCAYAVSGPDFYLRDTLPPYAREYSSGQPELLTVVATIERFWQDLSSSHHQSRSTVLWLTDSTNLCTFLEKGSTKPAIQKDILRVYRALRAANLFLLPVHLRREDPRIQIADAGSKWNDSDDWSLDVIF